MRLGDMIHELVDPGTLVIDQTDESSISAHLESLSFVKITKETKGAGSEAIVVRHIPDDSSERPSDVLGALEFRTLIVFGHVDWWLERDGLGVLARSRAEIVSCRNLEMPGLQHAMLVGRCDAVPDLVLRARNENRLLWMLSRGQETRLRQLRARLRNKVKELEQATEARQSAERQLEETQKDLLELEQSLDAFRRTATEERRRATEIAAELVRSRETAETLRRRLDRALALLEKTRKTKSFRVGRATAVAIRESKGNPIRLVSSWRDTFTGDDELLSNVKNSREDERSK